VFDHFDTGSYVGTFSDPAAHYLRRAPALAGAAELAVSCGSAMVKLPLTEPARGWMTSGTQSSWISLTPTVLSGSVPNVPNTLWTGTGSTLNYIFARNQSPGGNTFASSFSSNTSFDFCNGVADTASLVRVFYREVAPAPIRNTPSTARASCRAILAASESGGDGTYWLQQPPAPAYQAYCDMTSDGGGWTAVFAGRNGSPNVFDHFDNGFYTGTTSDPGSRYLRRAPAALASGELAVSCGGAMVSFPLTNPALAWMISGTQSGWISLTPTVLSGSVANPPNTLWTGSASDTSFIFARDQNAFGSTFASSYSGNTSFDFCNGVTDQASVVRLFYREPAPTVASVPSRAASSRAAARRLPASS
jgi:hypothetical protein